MENKKIYIAVAVAAVILLVLVLVISVMTNGGKPPVIAPTPAPTTGPLPETKTIDVIPTFAPGKGMGVDTTAPPVKASTDAVRQLMPYFPLEHVVTAGDGTRITVLIPGKESQNTAWTLTVNVYGVDFGVPASDPAFATEREHFRETASWVFSWLTGKGVDPTTVIISWGDRAYIQDRAEEWLRN